MTDKLHAVANIGIDTNKNKASDTLSVFIPGGVIDNISEHLDLNFGV
jgi:hypothetical protein